MPDRPPLYRDADDAPATLSGGCHAGLLYSRFVWNVANDNQQRDKWLRMFEREHGDAALLREYRARLECLGAALGVARDFVKVDWRYVSGLGQPHLLAPGFDWHPTLGVPFLRGEALKGLLKAWISHWCDRPPADEKDPELWFGGPDAAGSLIFLDALPIAPPRVELDIINRHYGSRAKPSADDLGDFNMPVPVTFLSVTDATFLVQVAARDAKARSERRHYQAVEHLEEAFCWLGAGARTGAGYGRLSSDPPDTRATKLLV